MKKIVITGCNRGIGYNLALDLLSKGYHVIGLNRTESIIEHEHYIEIYYNSEMDEKQLIPIIEQLSNIDVLILNAAMYYEKEFIDLTPSDFIQQLKTNSFGPFVLAKELIPKMKNKSKVISIGSKAESFLMLDSELYSISKQVFKGLMKSLSSELSFNQIYLKHIVTPRIHAEGEGEFSIYTMISLIDELIESKFFYNSIIEPI